ncbi:MAG TPA: long-chain-fatty-acid--CoA ligase [Blastocatellia bacterium]|nr:long-chain-fatty-acid--CoA ligase [Blastocatellia bacterium]
MNIADGLKKAAALNPAKTAVICGGARLNFEKLSERVDRLSSALAGLGLKRRDKVAILALNCHRYLETYYAVPQLGAIVVPVNFRLPPQEIKYILDHSESRALVVDDALAPIAEGLRPQLPLIESYISIGDEPREGYIAFEELLERGAPGFEPEQLEDGELLGLFYTSGTTGEPKGVMLTHRNVQSNVDHSDLVFQYFPDDIYLHAAPMFHLADGAAAFSNTARGATQAFTPRFDPTEVLEVISRERVTTTVLVPTMINLLLHHPNRESYDLSSLRQITYGASPIAPETLRRSMEVFGCRFAQGYGLTEAAPLLTVLSAADHADTMKQDMHLLASCGKPVPGVDVRVVDSGDRDVRPGEVGEIIARGANIMAGYWKRPEDTANAIRGGWLRTGDLATVDAEGYLYLVDRKKDMIVTGGENVFSTEVEAVLFKHPSIREAAVIGVPDETWGEAVHACITLNENHHVSEEELIDYCREYLAIYKLPRSVEVLDGELPKGGTGKILKKELRERHWKGQARRIS